MAITDFGVGCVVAKDTGEITGYYHSWPLKLFLYHFKGKGIELDEDWKAVIFSWGGPLPRFIERTELKHNLKEGEVQILYWLTDEGKKRGI